MGTRGRDASEAAESARGDARFSPFGYVQDPPTLPQSHGSSRAPRPPPRLSVGAAPRPLGGVARRGLSGAVGPSVPRARRSPSAPRGPGERRLGSWAEGRVNDRHGRSSVTDAVKGPGVWPPSTFTKDFPVTFVPGTELKKKSNLSDRSWERIPAARELAGAGPASPSLRGPAPVGRPGHRPPWAPRARAQRPGRRNRPLQPATRAGLSGVRLHVNIITRHQKQNPKSRRGVPNKKHIVRFPAPSFGRSHVCAPAATPPAKSMTSVGRNPPAPHHVRARPPATLLRPAGASQRPAWSWARSVDTCPAPASFWPRPFPDPGEGRYPSPRALMAPR